MGKKSHQIGNKKYPQRFSHERNRLQKEHGRGFQQQEGCDTTLKYLHEGVIAEVTKYQVFPFRFPSDCPK